VALIGRELAGEDTDLHSCTPAAQHNTAAKTLDADAVRGETCLLTGVPQSVAR
jgi:hypothetical protein